MPIAPTTKKMSHKFGEDRRIRRHNGVDYDVEKGTPVKASADGIVVRSTYHEPRELIFNLRTGNEIRTEKKFTGSYGNVIIINHGQDIEKLKHTYTIYAHLDSRLARVNQEVTEKEVIGTSGRTGTRADFDKKDSGYKLHFEVIETKKERSNWHARLETDYALQNQICCKDPEKFLTSSFKTVFADELVKELVAKHKGNELDRVDLDERTASSGGYFDLNFNVGVGVGITFGFLFSEDGVRPYIGYGFISPGWSATASRSKLTTNWNVELQGGLSGAVGVAGFSEDSGTGYIAKGVGTPGFSATQFYVPKKAIDPKKINVIYENYMD